MGAISLEPPDEAPPEGDPDTIRRPVTPPPVWTPSGHMFVKGSAPTIYEIIGPVGTAKRYPFPDMETFVAMGYGGQPIKTIEDSFLANFPLGPMLPSRRIGVKAIPQRPSDWAAMDENTLREYWVNVFKEGRNLLTYPTAENWGFFWKTEGLKRVYHQWPERAYEPLDTLGTRAPTDNELNQWYMSAALDRWGNSSWAVANGDAPFSRMQAPNGEWYLKFYNGDIKAHGDVPAGKIVIKDAGDWQLGFIKDIADFIGSSICKLGGVVVGLVTTPGAGATAARICEQLTGRNLKDGDLLKGTAPDIYVFSGGQRHLIPDQETFTVLGFSAANIQQLTDAELLAIPLGAAVPSRRTGFHLPDLSGAMPFIIGGGALLLIAMLIPKRKTE
jgi:hypothetical protein